MRLPRAYIAPLAVAAAVLAVGCSAPDDDESAVPNLAADDPAAPSSPIAGDDESAVRVTRQTEPSSNFGADSTVTTPAVPSPPTLSDNGSQETLAAPSTAAPATTASTAAPTTAAPSSSTVAHESTSSSSAPASTSSTATAAPSPLGPVDPAALATGEVHSNTLLTALRAGLELQELTRQEEMDQFARDWSRQMAESGTLEHSNGPYGENIAYTTNVGLTASEAADVFHQLWIDSPGHYRNMTNENYVTSGIGLYRTDNGWYGTHVFGFGAAGQ